MDPSISPDTHEDWVKTYGKTFRFYGFGRHDYRLMSLDFRVISHVLNSPIYEKPWQTRSVLSRLIGRGIFSMEGAEHKLQRKLVGPAFTKHSVKAMTPIFLQKAEELRDRWDAIISQVPSSPTHVPPATIDVYHWLSRAAFDVIGLAGFDYHFHALHDESEDVYLAYRKMFNATEKAPSLKGLVQLYFPWVETFFPDRHDKIVRNSLQIIKKAGAKIVAEKKAIIMAEKAIAQELRDKDLLSLLIKANLSSDPSTRMTDAELMDQLSTFLFAGSDSVSLAMSWCLHLLSRHPEIQIRLREEILSLSTSRPSTPIDDDTSPPPSATSTDSTSSEYAESDAINSLSFLDAVVREVLRLCPPVHATIRVATQTDSIPISSPIILRNGTCVNPGESITIGKGSYIHIPIEGLNLSTDVWGDDARQFNPDRWFCLPKSARAPANPGLANLMTFAFGPHSCPGWKFSIAEMKVFLAKLLPYFNFSPAADIRKYNAILTRPYVYDQFNEGVRLPIRVDRYVP